MRLRWGDRVKVIYSDNITSISASEEDASYPIANAMDLHPKKVWKGESSSAAIQVDISKGSALGIANTNALEVTGIVIECPAGAVWESGVEWDGIAWKVESVGTIGNFLTDTDTGDIWLDYDEVDSVHRITFTLTCASDEIIQAGVISAGGVISVEGPLYGVNEQPIDYSVVKELSNGSFYFRKRDVVRSYSCELKITRATESKRFMRDIGIKLGQRPIMWLIADDGDSQWVVFGRCAVSQSHDMALHNSVSISITEVV